MRIPEMPCLRFVCLCSVVCCTVAKWDDTVAPLTVVTPADTDNTTYNFHIARFGQVPYGSVIEGYARALVSDDDFVGMGFRRTADIPGC